jgi:hypothetical protein
LVLCIHGGAVYSRYFLKLMLIVAVLAGGIANTTHAQETTECPGAPKPRLVIKRVAHVTPGSSNNLRDKASKNGAVIAQIPGDAYIDVLDGPVCADGIAWWQVMFGGQPGWMAEGSGSTYFVEPATSPTTTFTLKEGEASLTVKYQNVAFDYNGAFGKTVEANTVYAVKPVEDNPFQQATPEYIMFTFPDKSNPDLPYLTPVLSVYPVADYAKLNEFASTQIADLKAMLKSKGEPPQQGVPVLPPVNAAQVFHAQMNYLDFQSGSGVRFLTIYAQAIVPVSADQLKYIFVGLTTNGKYYVTMNVPVSSPLLPKTYEEAKDFDAVMQANDNGATYNAYIEKQITLLNNAGPLDFEPSLDNLDRLVQSIAIQ